MEEIATRSMKDAAAVKLLTIIMLVYLPATIVLVCVVLSPLSSFQHPFQPHSAHPYWFRICFLQLTCVVLEFLLYGIYHQDPATGWNGSDFDRSWLDHRVGDIDALDCGHHLSMVALVQDAVWWSDMEEDVVEAAYGKADSCCHYSLLIGQDRLENAAGVCSKNASFGKVRIVNLRYQPDSLEDFRKS